MLLTHAQDLWLNWSGKAALSYLKVTPTPDLIILHFLAPVYFYLSYVFCTFFFSEYIIKMEYLINKIDTLLYGFNILEM